MEQGYEHNVLPDISLAQWYCKENMKLNSMPGTPEAIGMPCTICAGIR